MLQLYDQYNQSMTNFTLEIEMNDYYALAHAIGRIPRRLLCFHQVWSTTEWTLQQATNGRSAVKILKLSAA